MTPTPMTEAMSSTPPTPPPTLSSPTASSASLVTKARDTQELEEVVTVDEDSQEDAAETTTIKVENVEDLLKTSKFLRFEQEVLANFTRSARNHVRDAGDNKESAVAANSIPEDKAKEAKEVEVEAAPLVISSLLTPIATSTVARVTEAATEDSSSQVFFAYPDLPTFTIEPDTETFCELVMYYLSLRYLMIKTHFAKTQQNRRKEVVIFCYVLRSNANKFRSSELTPLL